MGLPHFACFSLLTKENHLVKVLGAFLRARVKFEAEIEKTVQECLSLHSRKEQLVFPCM